MAKFKDAVDREWDLDVGITAIKRLREAHGINLLEAVDGTLHEKMADPEKLADVLLSLTEEQRKKLGVNADQFVQSLRGDVLERSTDALMGAIADFLPTRQANILRQMNAKAREIADSTEAEMLSIIEQMDAKSVLGRPQPQATSPAAAEPAGEPSTQPTAAEAAQMAANQ